MCKTNKRLKFKGLFPSLSFHIAASLSVAALLFYRSSKYSQASILGCNWNSLKREQSKSHAKVATSFFSVADDVPTTKWKLGNGNTPLILKYKPDYMSIKYYYAVTKMFI